MPPEILVGTDLVDVERVHRLLAEQPEIAGRVFTDRELSYCTARRSRRSEHLAGRFAAKEAVFKALGGAPAMAAWTDVEVVNRAGGRPALRLHGRAASVARRRRLRHAEVTLSHAAGLAIAHVVLVCDPGTGPEQADAVPSPEKTENGGTHVPG
ncbi:holo-ACP synthase [Streptomyces cellostaticus]|uniref:holo-ACP synthase n=1 Tax=Streptomyces cellostaticus TaxID=67285 RepID=UPI00082EDF56|nr:holo-ACP synthase [Streptomyces cellostaticus]GHI04380.1 holo-[acyl-carrier-protein] synthase [Streptomyces cellostaticus]